MDKTSIRTTRTEYSKSTTSENSRNSTHLPSRISPTKNMTISPTMTKYPSISNKSSSPSNKSKPTDSNKNSQTTLSTPHHEKIPILNSKNISNPTICRQLLKAENNRSKNLSRAMAAIHRIIPTLKTHNRQILMSQQWCRNKSPTSRIENCNKITMQSQFSQNHNKTHPPKTYHMGCSSNRPKISIAATNLS